MASLINFIIIAWQVVIFVLAVLGLVFAVGAIVILVHTVVQKKKSKEATENAKNG